MIYQKLIAVQTALKAPKSQYNSFGKYAYRNCEDILEAVKPLLAKNGLTIFIADSLEQIGDRYYVKATVTLADAEDGTTIQSTAFAREEESKKGMDGSQVTGASSSYARKYALNGLFAIDDTKDSDTTNTETKTPAKTAQEPPAGDNTDYRGMMIRLCQEKGIDPAQFATERKISKATTQEEFRNYCKELGGNV